MTQRRAILHIGWPRTGTTTVQRLLSRHRLELAERGILYPDLSAASDPTPHLGHQYLGEVLDGRRSPREREALLSRLDQMLRHAPQDVVVMSYEGLLRMRRPQAAIARLSALLERYGFAMEIAATLKPQTDFLNSTYTWRCQFLREARPFASFVRAQLSDRRLDYARLLTPWRRLAAGRVHVVPVRDARDDSPLAIRLLGALGLAEGAAPLLTPADLALRENPSPGPIAVEVCRRLAQSGARYALGERTREATRLVECLALDRGLDQTPFKGFDPALRAMVQARFAAANDAFALSAWGEPWAGRVEEDPVVPPNASTARGDPAVAAIHQAIRERFEIMPGLGARLRARFDL